MPQDALGRHDSPAYQAHLTLDVLTFLQDLRVFPMKHVDVQSSCLTLQLHEPLAELSDRDMPITVIQNIKQWPAVLQSTLPSAAPNFWLFIFVSGPSALSSGRSKHNKSELNTSMQNFSLNLCSLHCTARSVGDRQMVVECAGDGSRMYVEDTNAL